MNADEPSRKQTRGAEYVEHLRHLARRATARPSGKRYARKPKHRNDDSRTKE